MRGASLRLALAAGLAGALAWGLGAMHSQAIRFLTPQAGVTTRTSVEVQVYVARDARNRAVGVTWNAPEAAATPGGFSRGLPPSGGGLVPIEPMTVRLGPGRYVFLATLWSLNAQERLVVHATDRRALTVCGRGGCGEEGAAW